MLIPAILEAAEIKRNMMKYFYTDDMMFWTGYPCNYLPDIVEQPDDSTFQFAIVNSTKDKLLGYITYKIDWYSGCAYNFGIFSFDRGNITVGRDIANEINKLIDEYKLHRIEWRAVEGNLVIRSYDRFCKKI